MDTEQIIWIVVIAVVALVLIGLIAAAMRKKSLAGKRTQAHQLRQEAASDASGLPDARAQAEQAAVQAERKRHEAERAEQEALAARTEVEQERARHEDRLRAADRLDPDVNHKAKDYSPTVSDPVGPSAVPADPAYADPETGRATGTVPVTPTSSTHGDGDLSDTSSRDSVASSHDETLRDPQDGDSSLRSDASGDRDTDPDNGGSHRA